MGKLIVRLKDIADKTGFSTNTVSLALRDSPRIPSTTRIKIQSAADALNYLPNQIAKSLVSRETKTIGLVLTQITNPALTATAQALERKLAARGYGMLFASSNNELEDEIRVLEMFRSRQVDGILIFPTSHTRLDHIHRLRAAGLPVVLLVADPASRLDSVSIDDHKGAYKATQHLISKGHTRIGAIDRLKVHDRSSNFGGSSKILGYRQALHEANIEFDADLHVDPNGYGAKAGYTAMHTLMEQDNAPTAVFASTDIVAVGAMKYCFERKLRVPQDMAITGFDNTEIAQFCAVPLTSVNYTADDVATHAVSRLMELIHAEGGLPAPKNYAIDPELIIRASSGGES